jgi:hypothetical protein
MRLPFLVALVLQAGAIVPGAAGAGTPCPTNSIDVGYASDSSTDPAHTWGSHAYDLVAGTLRSATSGGGEAGAFAQLRAGDRYRLVGPTSSVPIPFRVRLHATGVANGGPVTLPFVGNICTSSRVTLRILSGATNGELTVGSQPLPVCASAPIDATLEVALAHLPGEEFGVTFGLDPVNGPLTSIQVAATFSFVQLPPGTTIESCQGYAGPVVPAASRTWGRLKHAYR